MVESSDKTRSIGAQAGIKTAGRNINNLRYADNTTIMAESEKELKILGQGAWRAAVHGVTESDMTE